ncbi:unnamed protein product [Candidula unifasciata]|uniref:Phosphodiesterase n=1 Tax=Candidula unifasciata TaxID=100452 RepID=A0A8S3ZD80_9EUPU|nr:unnamed protein product [Candidula unifasciata]
MLHRVFLFLKRWLLQRIRGKPMGNKLNTTRKSSARKTNLNDFLLEVAKSIFTDIFNVDVVIVKIMNYAQRLVDADRASLFLVDEKKHELYARVFDVGLTCSTYRDLAALDLEEALKLSSIREIRFPISKGVAGYVATTGNILNIKDAYKDDRFNPEVDIVTGYKTKSILCMPIFIRGSVIGVVEMVNKTHGSFTKADEYAFELFAVYCGLALFHAELYEKIWRSEKKYKVALDVLSYHSQATIEELRELRQKPIPTCLPSITHYSFSPWHVSESNKPVYCLYMFKKLFGSRRYDLDDVMRFTLTVRKNYRKVPYHNWSHGFAVANTMFTIIETSQHQLNSLECLTLFVACLCHDLDHRGKTNQYMIQSSSPLAAVYTTSTLEHHHFNQTVTILQNEGHNIFKYLTSEQYKTVLGDMRRYILATDITAFFENRIAMEKILSTGHFSWDTIHHRNVLVALLMTACDLCSVFKPWHIHRQLVYDIMDEFWLQGDEEIMSGLVPTDLMDRRKKAALPKLQVDFTKSICLPCYVLVHRLLPDTKPMLDGCTTNLKNWQKQADDSGGTEV